MTRQIISNPARVWHFVNQMKNPVAMSAGLKGLGLEVDGELVAGVLYENYTGHNVWMHVAAVPGRRWLNREYLHYCFYYPFEEMGCKRVSGWVEAHNEDARRFDEHLGFRQEAVLHGAAHDGGDVILYVMWRDECKWLSMARK